MDQGLTKTRSKVTVLSDTQFCAPSNSFKILSENAHTGRSAFFSYKSHLHALLNSLLQKQLRQMLYKITFIRSITYCKSIKYSTNIWSFKRHNLLYSRNMVVYITRKDDLQLLLKKSPSQGFIYEGLTPSR